jgi:hypothetical protein
MCVRVCVCVLLCVRETECVISCVCDGHVSHDLYVCICVCVCVCMVDSHGILGPSILYVFMQSWASYLYGTYMHVHRRGQPFVLLTEHVSVCVCARARVCAYVLFHSCVQRHFC